VFALWQDRWGNTTGGYSFRFFSSGTGRPNSARRRQAWQNRSHDAIERILKHERASTSGIMRQIRRLKQPSKAKHYQRTAWSPEDDKSCEKAMGRVERESETPCANFLGASGCRLTRLGVGPPNSTCWENVKKGRLRSRQPWTEDDDRIFSPWRLQNRGIHRQGLTSIRKRRRYRLLS